jgi:hypothetical protein
MSALKLCGMQQKVDRGRSECHPPIHEALSVASV